MEVDVVFHWQPGAPASDCLFNFVALADADDPDDVRPICPGHGVLGLTEDAFPAAWAESDCPRVADDPEWRFERIADWRAHARNARTLMLLANAVKRGRRIDPVSVMGLSEAEWAAAIQRAGSTWRIPPMGAGCRPLRQRGLLVAMSVAPDVQEQRRLMTDWLEFAWLDRAMIFPTIEWGKYHWQEERRRSSQCEAEKRRPDRAAESQISGSQDIRTERGGRRTCSLTC